MLYRLHHPERTPLVVVAGVRALLQRLGTWGDDAEPIVVRPGDTLDPDELCRRLAVMGYRREELVEHRGEFARRGAIVDIFPSTAETPIRIDLWGDEVDRLTEFRVSDQRSTDTARSRGVFPPASWSRRRDARPRRRPSSPTEPWGREQWERLAEGCCSRAWRAGCRGSRPTSNCSPTCSATAAQVVLVEPRRMRDRAADLLAEEDDLAAALSTTWGRERDETFPASTPSPIACSAPDRSCAPSISIVPTPEAPDSPAISASTWAPVVGEGSGVSERLRALLGEGYRVVVAADGAGSAARLGRPAARPGPRPPDPATAAAPTSTRPGRLDRRRPAAPRLLDPRAEARRRLRGRPHGPAPRPPPAPSPASATPPASSRTSSRATTSSTTSTASASTPAW